MTCFIPAGQTAADPHEQGQQSCPLHQEKVLTTGSLSTSHQQEWVPNKRHDFKWISQWTLNVWSEVSDSAVRSPAEEHVKSRARSEPNAPEGALWPQEGMIFGRTFNICSMCLPKRSSEHTLTFTRNENEPRLGSVIYRKIHLWAITEHPIWTTSVSSERGTVELVEPSGQNWTKSHLNITCHLHRTIIL